MKLRLFTAGLFVSGMLLGETPIPFRITDSGLQYDVSIEFDSPQEAQDSKLEFLPLPEGKRVAFSTRWDDSNPKHVRMAQLLAKHGFRGTFYLTSPNRAFCSEVLAKLFFGGHSIGNHTLNHHDLTALVPNEIVRQILQNRVELESQSNREVNAFVLPYCRFWRSDNPASTSQIGEALRRSGKLGSPEYYQDLGKKYGMHSGKWFGSMLFTVNDRNPDASRFEREVEKRLKQLTDKPFIHITLGMHTWQNDNGFATLGRCFEKYGNRPEWWYCNENEYLSYRFISLNTIVRRKKVEGTKAIFTLEQAYPISTGAYVPLWAKVSPPAKDGKRLTALSNPDLRPEKIDSIFIKNGRISSAKKYPGLSAGLDYNAEKQLLRLTLVNETTETLTLLSATYRLPLLFENIRELLPICLGDLKPGKRLESTLPLTVAKPETLVGNSGTLFFAVELNFMTAGKMQRLWVCMPHDRPSNKEAVPRNCAMISGPFDAGTFNLTKARWAQMKNPPLLLPGFVKIPRNAGKEYAVLLNVMTKHAMNYPLHINRKNLQALYLNKQKITLPPPSKLSLKRGNNEMIAVFTADGEESVFAVSSEGDPTRPLPCVLSKTGN